MQRCSALISRLAPLVRSRSSTEAVTRYSVNNWNSLAVRCMSDGPKVILPPGATAERPYGVEQENVMKGLRLNYFWWFMILATFFGAGWPAYKRHGHVIARFPGITEYAILTNPLHYYQEEDPRDVLRRQNEEWEKEHPNWK